MIGRKASSDSLLLLALVAGGSTERCTLSTDGGTGELHLSGTVHFLRAEIVCWQLETTTGDRYELQPQQAPASVLRDGAVVSLVGAHAEERTTGCRVGVPLEVRRVVSVRVGE